MKRPRNTQPTPAIRPDHSAFELEKEVARKVIPNIPISNLSASPEVPIESAIASKASPTGSSIESTPAINS